MIGIESITGEWTIVYRQPPLHPAALSIDDKVALHREFGDNPNEERAEWVKAALRAKPKSTVRQITKAVNEAGYKCTKSMIARDMRALRKIT